MSHNMCVLFLFACLYFSQLITINSIDVHLCQTMVTIEDKNYPFSTSSSEKIHKDSIKFCNKYRIADDDCAQIRKYHISQCYPNKIEAQSKSSYSYRHDGKSNINVNDDVKFESVVKNEMSTHTQDSKQNNVQKIDYSMKIGPILPIYGLEDAITSVNKKTKSGEVTIQNNKRELNFQAMDGISFFDKDAMKINDHQGIHYLQSYLGELPQQSVARFCDAKKLHNDLEFICKQIEHSFLALYDITSDISDVSDNENSTHQQSTASNITLWNRISQFGLSVYQDYFQIILLLLSICYILLLK